MQDHRVFWKLEALSNRQLLERVGSMLGSSRQLIAELIAHLGEVEERRLHLVAGCSSMFAYCLKLGMTEDEAYRRIEVARLARRYPTIFPLLANGQLSISVVALLKHHLSEENHLELLAAVTGKSVGQARELIAARFPRPDVPSSVRKLPERRTMIQPSLDRLTPAESRLGETERSTGGTEPSTGGAELPTGGTEPSIDRTEPRFTSNRTAPHADGTERSTGGTELPHSRSAAPLRVSSRIEPLSAQRYKVQLTASAELARKLELARDLMRHCHPDGELGPIVERALDLLIESLMQRRFGKKATPKRVRERTKHIDPEQRGDIMGVRSATPDTAEADTTTLSDTTTLDIRTPDAVKADTREFATPTPDPADLQGAGQGELERALASPYIPRSTRRTVVERDGLGCSWVDERGARVALGHGSSTIIATREPRAAARSPTTCGSFAAAITVSQRSERMDESMSNRPSPSADGSERRTSHPRYDG